jgi:hypothetical protein
VSLPTSDPPKPHDENRPSTQDSYEENIFDAGHPIDDDEAEEGCFKDVTHSNGANGKHVTKTNKVPADPPDEAHEDVGVGTT